MVMSQGLTQLNYNALPPHQHHHNPLQKPCYVILSLLNIILTFSNVTSWKSYICSNIWHTVLI